MAQAITSRAFGAEATLGKYRYLLFDIVTTEMDDDWGNTFYSEVDVVAKKPN